MLIAREKEENKFFLAALLEAFFLRCMYFRKALEASLPSITIFFVFGKPCRTLMA